MVSIEQYTFSYDPALTNFYDNAAVPQVIDSTVFFSGKAMAVHVPAASFGLYQTNWLLAGYLPSGSSIVSQ